MCYMYRRIAHGVPTRFSYPYILPTHTYLYKVHKLFFENRIFFFKGMILRNKNLSEYLYL